MNPYIILVAGIPASGKTTYARHISTKLSVPLISKDIIKEHLYDALMWDTSNRDNSKLYGFASYQVLLHIIDSLLKVGVSLIAECNFISSFSDNLQSIIDKYSCRALTVLFDTDLTVLKKRFNDRDKTNERHPGLVMPTAFGGFTAEEASRFRDFCIGDKIVVDTTDFTKVDFAKVDTAVVRFTGGQE